VVQALNRISATQTMEDFISFILGIAANTDEVLRPVYSIVPHRSDGGWIAPKLAGYRGDGRCASGNACSRSSAALTPMAASFSQPCRCLRSPPAAGRGDNSLFRLLEGLGQKAAHFALKPDAGIWEFRGRQRVHTHSAAMCWAGCHRLAGHRLASRAWPSAPAYWDGVAGPIHAALVEQAWNPRRGAFTAAFGSDELDASGAAAAGTGGDRAE
jgi:hypothetical protein